MKFSTIIILAGKTATGFEVPEAVVAELGAGKKPAVKVTIGDYTYRSTVAVMGGKFMIPLSAENRGGAGVAAGDEVEVRLELDLEPREIAVPADVMDALRQAPGALSFFDGLSYSNRRRIIMNIDAAKTAETRQRRIAKAAAELSEGRMP
jgi:hypothetical protein